MSRVDGETMGLTEEECIDVKMAMGYGLTHKMIIDAEFVGVGLEWLDDQEECKHPTIQVTDEHPVQPYVSWDGVCFDGGGGASCTLAYPTRQEAVARAILALHAWRQAQKETVEDCVIDLANELVEWRDAGGHHVTLSEAIDALILKRIEEDKDEMMEAPCIP